jgi:hypothetical protein
MLTPYFLKGKFSALPLYRVSWAVKENILIIDNVRIPRILGLQRYAPINAFILVMLK